MTSALCCQAQSLKIDSLRQELSQAEESNSYDILWGLAYELYDIDNENALVYALRANKIAILRADSIEIVKSGRIKGQLLRRANDLSAAVTEFQLILPISKRYLMYEETVKILNALAICHSFQAEYDKALSYHFQSLIMAERSGNQKAVSNSLSNIGVLHFQMKNDSLALQYYLKSKKIKSEIKYKTDIDRLFINIGLSYANLHQFDSANHYLESALAIRNIDDWNVQLNARRPLACFSQSKRDLI